MAVTQNASIDMAERPEKPRRSGGATGLAIPAGLFIGLGVGLLVDQTAAGVLLGLGGGFLVMGILRVLIGEW